MKHRNLPELEYLAQLVGEFIEYWGFKRIHGQIWLHLYLSEAPLDAADIMRKLSISKALVSISLKSLMDYQVIQEEGLSPTGTKLYSANPDLQSVITSVLRKREKVMMGKIQAAFTQLKQAPKEQMIEEKIEMKRMKDLDRFIKNGEKGLNTLMVIL
jgi:DNA-binding transcriptional regulator GbsR (MarR family)